MPARRSSAAHRPTKARAPDVEHQRDAILDAALALAGERGWSVIHLHDVADRLGISLAEIRHLFPDKDAVGNRLYTRATDAMLALRDQTNFRTLPTQERIYRAITTWLDTLAEHRATARNILLYKFAPTHVHHQAALVVALSRTVQWIREAAELAATGRGRRREEMWLTLLLTATVLFWFADPSPHQERTRAFLHRRLEAAGACLAWA